MRTNINESKVTNTEKKQYPPYVPLNISLYVRFIRNAMKQ